MDRVFETEVLEMQNQEVSGSQSHEALSGQESGAGHRVETSDGASVVDATKMLSEMIHYMKYARYLPEQQRRETWGETVARNLAMHTKHFPALSEVITDAYDFVLDRKVLPSMRSMQFAGSAIEKNPARMYNCSFAPVDHPFFFAEAMFLLLSGCGVGYSVQQHHVAKLPDIRAPRDKHRHLVADTIEGWSSAVHALCRAFFKGDALPVFDYSEIRPKGTPLVTSGGRAPGAEPLKRALSSVERVFLSKKPGTKLHPIEAHDILCHLSEAVLAGGIRRSSFICLFSEEDQDMLCAKEAGFWNHSPQRARANNSVVLQREELEEQRFWRLWDRVRGNGSGEPGIFLSNSMEMGTNPCAEIALRPYGLCNLVEVNAASVEDQADLEARCRAAARIATCQAAWTGFHFLRPVWRRCAEEDALIGVSMTGIAAGRVEGLDVERAARVVLEENARIASALGLRPSARCTTVKPAGTTSLLLGCSSGIHAYHAPYYLRRVVINNNEPILAYLKQHLPALVERSVYQPDREHVFQMPIQAPVGAVTREQEDALALLERVRDTYQRWIVPGHRTGENTNNISCTVSVKDDEWDDVGRWMWRHRHDYVALSVLPHDGGGYPQAPFEACDAQTFARYHQHIRPMDFSQILETQDHTTRQDTVACAGGVCEII